ncbi:MAG: hypothetical protein WBE48_01760 [Xanthobacteraceae bacterium]
MRTLIGHLPKETRAKSTWQLVDTKLREAAAGGDVADLWAAAQPWLAAAVRAATADASQPVGHSAAGGGPEPPV